jgi:hypothetical protein
MVLRTGPDLFGRTDSERWIGHGCWLHIGCAQGSGCVSGVNSLENWTEVNQNNAIIDYGNDDLSNFQAFAAAIVRPR